MRSWWHREHQGHMLRRPPRGKDSAKRRCQTKPPPAFSKASRLKMGLLVLDPTLARTCPPTKGWWPAVAIGTHHSPGGLSFRGKGWRMTRAHPSRGACARKQGGVTSESMLGLGARHPRFGMWSLLRCGPLLAFALGPLHGNFRAGLWSRALLRDLVPFWLCSAA